MLLSTDVRIRLAFATRPGGQSGWGTSNVSSLLHLMKTHYYVSGAEFYLLEQVCRAWVQLSGAFVYFRKWLQDNEALSGSLYFWLSPQLLYKIFHASCLQRCFLRYILVRPLSAVLAGGFLVYQHLLSTGGCDWSTKDIDVFLADAALLDDVGDLYRTMVLVPLRLDCFVRTWKKV